MQPWNANPSGWDSLHNFTGTPIPNHKLVLLTRNRDSGLLSQSNWDTVLAHLGGESGENDDGTYSGVEIVRHGHWACGWIEYMLIDANNKPLLAQAEEVEKRLDSYPIFDEEDWGRREMEATWEYWQQSTLADRVYECQRARVSIFAARRTDDIPERVEERLRDIVNE